MEQQIKKTQRVRSPNYPNYSLRECITFLEKLYQKYGTSEVHVEDAVKQMGHSPTSSTSGRVFASMFSFSLLESRGTKDNKFVRISKLAQEILLEDEDSPERFDLLKQAALSDGSMQAVWKKWSFNLPHESSIKKSLQIEMGYSPEGAKRFAFVIIDTYNFAHLAKSDFEESEDGSKPDELKKAKDSDKYIVETDKASSMRKANLLLQGSNREIVIYAPGDLTDAEFDLFLKWLDLQKYGLVTPV